MSRVEIVSRGDAEELLQLDPGTLDKTKHYRFVNVARARRRMAQGYEYVRRSEHGVRLLYDPEDEKSADDLIRVGGDLVLMQCDKTTYNTRRKRRQQLAAERLGSTEESFKERAQKRGVRSLTGDEGE